MSWIITIIPANQNLTGSGSIIKLLRKQEYIRRNSMMEIVVNGFDDYIVNITTDYDGVKDAIEDTLERHETGIYQHERTIKEA